MGVFSQLKHAWNAFSQQPDDMFRPTYTDWGASYGSRPDRPRLRVSNERSIISSIYMRLAIDVASIELRHVRLDDQNRYIEDIRTSGLSNCLSLEANIDQAAQAFFVDSALTMFDEGCIAIIPVDTNVSLHDNANVDILTMRVGKITQWFPRHVRVEVLDDRDGRRKEITVPKASVAIIENPLYTVMNEPNSTLQRLIRKLNLLDSVDEQSSSGKLDLIIQLPYVIKSEARREQAEKRRKDIEFQLKGSQYGIAYTDGTEKITQLNRPAENNLLKQVEYLTEMLYGQLGLTPEIMLGTATEEAMLNYINRTLAPILTAYAQEMKRKFLSKTARTQGQSIEFFRDPFKLVPMKDLAELADKFTRNEIVSSNEFRGFIGMRPSKDPKADLLINSNMPQPMAPPQVEDDGVAVEDAFAGINQTLDEVFKELGEPPNVDA